MSARDYARTAHAKQTYGSEPYTVHLEAVVAIVRVVDSSPEAEAVAWLHDVLEDTPATEGELAGMFGEPVAAAVAFVTDPEGYPSRRTRKAALHASLATLDPGKEPDRLALLVKTADRLANVRACVADSPGKLKMYRREHADFRAATHRAGLCDDLWTELDALLGGVA